MQTRARSVMSVNVTRGSKPCFANVGSRRFMTSMAAAPLAGEERGDPEEAGVAVEGVGGVDGGRAADAPAGAAEVLVAGDALEESVDGFDDLEAFAEGLAQADVAEDALEAFGGAEGLVVEEGDVVGGQGAAEDLAGGGDGLGRAVEGAGDVPGADAELVAELARSGAGSGVCPPARSRGSGSGRRWRGGRCRCGSCSGGCPACGGRRGGRRGRAARRRWARRGRRRRSPRARA